MTDNTVNRVAMLSTHGFFDPVPRLGRTDTGGQVVYVLELAKALARIGIPVDIYTRWFDQEQDQVDPVPGNPDVRVIRIPAGPWEFIPKEKIYDVLPELTSNMIRFINENEINYDLFHGHYVDAGIVALGVAKHFKKPCYFTAHSLGAWKRDQMGGDPAEMEKKFNFELRIREELNIFRNVNAQSVTSDVQQEKLEQLYEDRFENVEVIPPGVDIHRYVPPDENSSPNPKLPGDYIYTISRIDTNKGHDLLLEAFEIVAKKNSDVQLVIGGGSPNPKTREINLLSSIQELIDSKNLKERVHLIGYVPDEEMIPNYQYARFFILPSLFEPFGMTTQEAMSIGKAVIASKLGGIRNVIDSGKNGVLVDPRDKEEFSNAMISLLENREETEMIGRNAHDLIIREYSWEAMAERHLRFYSKYL
jgi:mannosylfructose-phosphate synthase